MTPEIIGGLVRAVLSALGGVMVARGLIDSGTVETIIGSSVTIAVAVWSVVAKNRAAKKLAAVQYDPKPLNPL